MAKHDFHEVVDAAKAAIASLRELAATDFVWKSVPSPGVSEMTCFMGTHGGCNVTVMRFIHEKEARWDGVLTDKGLAVRLPPADAKFVYEAAEKKATTPV